MNLKVKAKNMAVKKFKIIYIVLLSFIFISLSFALSDNEIARIDKIYDEQFEKLSSAKKISEIQVEYCNLKNISIFNPTEINVAKYLGYRAAIIQKSFALRQEFSKQINNYKANIKYKSTISLGYLRGRDLSNSSFRAMTKKCRDDMPDIIGVVENVDNY
jgi:hypothetical protein